MAKLRRAPAEHRELSLLTDPILPDEESPVLTLNAIQSICSLCFPESDFSSLPVEDLAAAIHAVTSTVITPVEEALVYFTYRQLQSLSTWPDWQHGEFKQLDCIHNLAELTSAGYIDCLFCSHGLDNPSPSLCDSQCFSHRTVLGELLYAYISCQPDICYAVVTLSKFASARHAYQYNSLKGVAQPLLHQTLGYPFHLAHS
ncbi:hypothetical protein IV203_036046 [Nitzschia inconspicua]|uniref:Uncharacterized protein n=1 Tax=Nitzschia inconspicua TaxID=303405 RepID=A0A9K3LF98_9STRA|nr:hypothetical protein IV203_036046 [Nitzschia inconspicua]